MEKMEHIGNPTSIVMASIAMVQSITYFMDRVDEVNLIDVLDILLIFTGFHLIS